LPETEPTIGVRVDEPKLQQCLTRLEREASEFHGINLRTSARFAYQSEPLPIEVIELDEHVTRYMVVPRNLSRGGVSVLTGRMIYPQTACRVTLRSPYGWQETVSGRVVRCRYVSGSGAIYEAGIRFDHAIDLPAFAPHGKLVAILLVCQAEAMERLVSGFLHGMNTDLVWVADEPSALQTVTAREFDLVLIDIDGPGKPATALAQRLRRDGCVMPILALTVDSGDEVEQRCEGQGFTGYMPKPVTREALRNVVSSLMDKPLVSTLAQDRALAPLIDDFVGGLRERVAQMSQAFDQGNLAIVESIARALHAEGSSYGFESITRAGAYLQALIAASESRALIQRELLRLMHLCLLARPTGSTVI
jgi:CheY-like chemotaxis protein